MAKKKNPRAGTREQKTHKHESPENGAAGSAESTEPDENNTDTIEILRPGQPADRPDTDGGSVVDKKRPSDKEILNRLLEKNEIILDLNRENAEKDKQLKELNDKWLRSMAEFENYRKRTRKEWELLKQQSKAEVILEILEIVDDFERAFSVAGDANSDEFIQGIRLIYNNLTSVLGKFGVSEIEALNNPFDPNFHMAIGQIDNGDVPSGAVAEVVQKGYKLDDSVIRPARVIVAR